MKKDLRGQEVKKINEDDIPRIKAFYKETHIRMYALFTIGINLGLRISDLKKIKFEDITDDNEVFLIEKKTGKKRTIIFNKACMEMVKLLKKEYRSKGIHAKGYLFKSYYRKYIKNQIDAPLSTVSINKFLKVAKKELDITYPVGTHSMRKTWGYLVYKREKDVALLMGMLNHSTPRQTMTYIGMDDERYAGVYRSYVF